MTSESTQVLRKNRVSFSDTTKNYSCENHSCLPADPQNIGRKWSRQSIVKSYGIDLFSTSLIDGYDRRNKYMIIDNPASEANSYNFWTLIWDENCQVIIRFDKNTKNWLSDKKIPEYAAGEFLIRKEVITDKFYTELELTVVNNDLRKSRKITHYRYHGFPDLYSSQLVLFLKMINKKQEDYIADSDTKNIGSMVIHSVDSLERAVIFCTLDICLDQFIHEKSMSVSNALYKIKSRIPFESYNLEESYINILLRRTRAFDIEAKSKSGYNELKTLVKKRIPEFKLGIHPRFPYKLLGGVLGRCLLWFPVEILYRVLCQLLNDKNAKCVVETM